MRQTTRSVNPSQTRTTNKKVTNMTAVEEKTATVDSTVNDQPVVDATKPYEGSDPVAAAMFPMMQQLFADYASLNSKLLAADGDKEKIINDFIENSDNKDAVRLRDVIAKAQEKLRALAEKEVVTEDVSEDQKTKWRTQLDEWRSRIKAAKATIKTISESTSSDPEGILAYMAAMNDPTASNRGRKPGSAGSTLPRTSCTVAVEGGELKPTTFDTMSAAAIKLNIELEDLQKAFASAAGVEHKDISSVKEVVTFDFQPNENGSVYKITTRPKERKARGSSVEESKTEETVNA